MLDTQPTLGELKMKSALIIKDLSLDKALDSKAMSAVRGGLGSQANSTGQSNTMEMLAPVSVGNGSAVCGPVTFQVDSNPTQTATNYNTSTNDKGFGWYEGWVA
jgi:hypothetical protein